MDIYPADIAAWSRSRIETAIKRRAQSVYLGDGVVLARVLGRHKIFLRSSDHGFACHVMLDGYWEMWLTQFLAGFVSAGMTVFDVGANFGYYTLLFADAVGENGKVVAVEPNPDTAELLMQTVMLNGYCDRTTIVPHALDRETGVAWLFSPNNEPKNASIVDRSDLPGGKTTRVSTLTLDSIALDFPKVDLVKIDAEGAEVGVVTGMARLIARDHPTIVLEFNPARYADPAAFLQMLLDAYGGAKEIGLDGTVIPLNVASVIDRQVVADRLLLFGY